MFFSVNIYAQFKISEKVNSDKYISLNFDSLLTIKRLTLDSIILSQVSIPKLLKKDIDESIEGHIYYDFIVKNKILLETKLRRGLILQIDTILKQQHAKVFEIINKYIQTESNKTYQITISIDKTVGDKDTIFFEAKNREHFVFQVEQNIIKKPLFFHPEKFDTTHIPSNIEECIKILDLMIDSTSKKEIINGDENDFSSRAHMGLGMWIRNNFELWGYSELKQYFIAKGVFHPDNMSGIILVSYYRHLTGKKIRLKKQINHYIANWEKYQEEKFKKYVIGDTVTYKYKLGVITDQQSNDYDSKKCTKGKIISKRKKGYLLKVELIDDCGGEGIYYLDIKTYEKLEHKKLPDEELRKRVVKTMRTGESNWFYSNYWRY